MRIIDSEMLERRRNTHGAAIAMVLFALGCRTEPAGPPAQKAADGAPKPHASAAASPAHSASPSLEASGSDAPLELPEQTEVLPLGVYTKKEDPRFEDLVRRLESWAKKHDAQVSAIVLDTEKRTTLVELNAGELRNPASNQKLFTAAAALTKLGPGFRFRTEIRGVVSDDGSVAELGLVGGGAPDFSTSDVYRLVRSLVRLGVKSVGKLTVDQSLISSHFLPFAYEQQPNEWAPFRAPVSALAIDKNTVTLEVIPSTPKSPARFFLEPPGAVAKVSGAIETSDRKGDNVTWSLASDSAGKLVSEVGGSLGVDDGRRRYTRRLDDPRLSPGYVFKAAMLEFGVVCSKEPVLGKAPKEKLLHLDSEPLSNLVFELGKESDNFTAEMLLLALSAAQSKSTSKSATKAAASSKELTWSAESGIAELRSFLGTILPQEELDRLVFRNGSGLFDANRVSARSLALLLAQMRLKPEVFPEFMAELAVGGVDGTLSKRLKSKRGKIRAKTGTLKDAIALSGYAEQGEGKPPLVFSVLVNGPPKAIASARDAVDQFALELVP